MPYLPLLARMIRTLLSIALGVFLLRVGLLHFTGPEWFEPIVPPMAGSARFWVHLSGGAEILLGVGLMIPALRRPSALGTAAFLILVYPANLNMWMNNLALGDGTTLSTSGHIIRLLVQVAAIGACIWLGRKH